MVSHAEQLNGLIAMDLQIKHSMSSIISLPYTISSDLSFGIGSERDYVSYFTLS